MRGESFARRVFLLIIGIAVFLLTWRLGANADAWLNITSVMVLGSLAAFSAAAAVSLWTGSRVGRRYTAAVALGSVALAHAALGARVVTLPLLPNDARVDWVAAALFSVLTYGLFRHQRWARWLTLALTAASLVVAVINWISYAGTTEVEWLWAISTIYALILLVLLGGRAMAASDRRVPEENVWQQRDPMIRWLRAAAAAGVVAAPLLLVYAWVQTNAVEPIRSISPYLALWIGVATVLTVVGRSLGAMMLVIGGVALTGHTVALFCLTPVEHREIAGYYLLFWGPAAITAVVSGFWLARASWCLLRSD
jgi:hypothetical protein